jgi:hypothetical protein
VQEKPVITLHLAPRIASIVAAALALLSGQPAAPPPAPAPSAATMAQAMRSLPASPTLAQVQAAALRRAHLDLGDTRRWLRRARAAFLLPTVSAGYDVRNDRGWTLDQEPGLADELRTDLGNVATLRLKATWELDRAVFNPDELRAARATLDLVDWRERVLIDVTRLYFERMRLLLERSLAPAGDLASAIEREVRLHEVEGVLAGLTGIVDGWTTLPPAH